MTCVAAFYIYEANWIAGDVSLISVQPKAVMVEQEIEPARECHAKECDNESDNL